MSTARGRVYMAASRQGDRALRLVSEGGQPDSPYPKASLWLRASSIEASWRVAMPLPRNRM